MARSCPGCESRMQVFKVRTVEIDRCPFCGGLWFDRGELEAVTRKPLAVERFEGHTSRRCAFCQLTLATAFVGSVPAEVCTTCLGTYLDDGELEELAQRRVSMERVGAPVAREEVTYRCVGCGDALNLDTGITTSRGISCRNCYGRSDFGGPSPTSPSTTYGSRALLEERMHSDLPEGLLMAAIRFFMA